MPKVYRLSFNTTDLKSSLPLSTNFKSALIRANQFEYRSHLEPFFLTDSMSLEHASRLYLQSFILGTEQIDIHDITSPERPQLVPDFRFTSATEMRLTRTTAVEFQQEERAIPIFGARSVVEVDGFNKSLKSIEATLTERPNVSPVASISPEAALNYIYSYGKRDTSRKFVNTAPKLVFFPGKDEWRLAYHFTNVPVFPPGFDEDIRSTNEQPSPRLYSPYHDYFVDAHNGEVFYYFSSSPRLSIPVNCTGIDDETRLRNILGQADSAQVILNDPMRKVITYDFGMQDVDVSSSAIPATPVANATPDFNTTNTAAISAHYNGSLVFDFFNNILKRNGIDDKGMVLESVVNVYSSINNPKTSPEWENAMWWNNRMWYGQVSNGAGRLTSFAKYLDIIGHELTHGVTETTSALVYRDLPGALNESFSDIFGIFIKNWYPNGPNPLSAWDWEMGSGLGHGGGGLRNFQNPAVCGQPDHFSQYVPIAGGYGGVHLYSGIHNLAAYNVLTSKNSAGDYIFSPNEVAILYYITLTRLARMSDFSDCRRVLLNVAAVYYMGSVTLRMAKQKAIEDAYDAVGIY